MRTFWMAERAIIHYESDAEPKLYPDLYVKCIRLSDHESQLAEHKRLLGVAYNAMSDADFVLEGSRAIKQSDDMLERRENALMRFFEALDQIKKVIDAT